ncbi:MAG: beta-N-acetylhexosaminidase [Paludibacter sp.]
MKIILAILLSISSSLFAVVKEANYFTIPLAQKITLSHNKPFELNSEILIIVENKNKKMIKNAQFLSDYLNLATGLKLKITSNQKSKYAIILKKDTSLLNIEAYTISINDSNIMITGKTEIGVFYGIQTLRKSISGNNPTDSIFFPSVEINDSPRFVYRGMLLDVSRHFFSVSFIKKYIDILALHNINNFHLHLTDDQGWRIEIKKYPMLTKVGSIRSETVIGRNTGVYDSIPYGGYYTQKEIKEIVRYAAERYINVVPEIDMPGHMLAALASYPELGCSGLQYNVATKWGVFDDVLCVGNEKTYRFVENVLSEVISLFPSKYIHIGGDECMKVKWEKCPKCQLRIVKEGFKSDSIHRAETKLQSYFIARMEKFLNRKGRQIIGWDEILEGGLTPNATVMSWRGTEGGVLAAKQKHNVIMSPNSHLYFNYYQSPTSVEEIYNYNPIPLELAADEQKYIIGVQANLWTEYITTEQQAEYMTLPRLAALCEVQWTAPEKKNYADFLLRIKALKNIYSMYSYNYATFIF